jgi:hypothetical protein
MTLSIIFFLSQGNQGFSGKGNIGLFGLLGFGLTGSLGLNKFSKRISESIITFNRFLKTQ